MPADDLSMRTNFRQGITNQQGPAVETLPAIRVGYGGTESSLEAGALLAAIHFGPAAPSIITAPLAIQVQLDPLDSAATTELWFAHGTVTAGRAGLVRFAHDDHFLFAAIDVDERDYGGILAATETVYAAVRDFQQGSSFAHLLRMWNFLDAVNKGEGDSERYRQFCVGRSRGLAESSGEHYPAATAIGRQCSTHELQVYWLAARQPGTAVENPRQISAYRYPRTHGPVSPSFSRATVTPDGTLLISGTASIVGHVSQHPDDPLAQLDETLRNLDTLIERAGRQNSAAAAHEPVLLKIYVRNPDHIELIAARVRARFPNDRAIFVAADICRRELLLEIECVIPASTSV